MLKFGMTLMGLSIALAGPALGIDVVASVKPVYSLVAGVMEGTSDTPTLVVEGANSPHGFTMRPSDVDAVSKADVIFWIGDSYEIFLDRIIPTVAPQAASVALIESPGIEPLPFREGGLFENHAEDEDVAEPGDLHEEEGSDPHVWLDPDMAADMVTRIAEELSILEPGNAPIYQANAQALVTRLSGMKSDIKERLQDVSGGFFVFHDAYHYYERAFGIEATGAFTINPTVAPGVQRLDEIRQTIDAAEATCVFTEPQFSPSVLEALARDTGAKIGVLDPLGADIADGPELYFELMDQLTVAFEQCLS